MTPAAAHPVELPVVLFEQPAAWEAWLAAHHATAPGLWLRLARKDGGLRSVTYAEALDVALCWGWIDSQKKAFDAASWLQKFSPRGAKSLWSRVNREKVRVLEEAGRMQPPGALAVERARADGRWEAAYDSPRTATVPDDLRAALDASPDGAAAFAALDGANRYAVLFRVQTAKTEAARAKRVSDLVAMLARGERIHP